MSPVFISISSDKQPLMTCRVHRPSSNRTRCSCDSMYRCVCRYTPWFICMLTWLCPNSCSGTCGTTMSLFLCRLELCCWGGAMGLFLKFFMSAGASQPEVLPAGLVIRTGHVDQSHLQLGPLTEQGQMKLYTWMVLVFSPTPLSPGNLRPMLFFLTHLKDTINVTSCHNWPLWRISYTFILFFLLKQSFPLKENNYKRSENISA